MNRRGFLQSILAAGVAPAFIGSSVLMPVRSLLVPRDRLSISPTTIIVSSDMKEAALQILTANALWPGIKEWYYKTYESYNFDHSCQDGFNEQWRELKQLAEES